MSKRVVLSALAALAGGPMLTAKTAPLGILLLAAAGVLLALPRLGHRAVPS